MRKAATSRTEDLKQGMEFHLAGQNYVITNIDEINDKDEYIIQFALIDPDIALYGTLVLPADLYLDVHLY